MSTNCTCNCYTVLTPYEYDAKYPWILNHDQIPNPTGPKPTRYGQPTYRLGWLLPRIQILKSFGNDKYSCPLDILYGVLLPRWREHRMREDFGPMARLRGKHQVDPATGEIENLFFIAYNISGEYLEPTRNPGYIKRAMKVIGEEHGPPKRYRLNTGPIRKLSRPPNPPTL